MPADSTPDRDRGLPSSPYGPQRGRVDEAAGGADSSPYETTPSGEKADAANDPPTTRRRAGDEPDRPTPDR